MGKYYAEAQGEDEAVAQPARITTSRRVRTTCADRSGFGRGRARRQDRHAGWFWAIDEKPTGSKDPYALRRAALGVIRLVVDNSIRLRCLRFAT